MGTYIYEPQAGRLEGRVFEVQIPYRHEVVPPEAFIPSPVPSDGDGYHMALMHVVEKYYALLHEKKIVKVVELKGRVRRRIVPDAQDGMHTFEKIVKQFVLRHIHTDPLNPRVKPWAPVRTASHE